MHDFMTWEPVFDVGTPNYLVKYSLRSLVLYLGFDWQPASQCRVGPKWETQIRPKNHPPESISKNETQNRIPNEKTIPNHGNQIENYLVNFAC